MKRFILTLSSIFLFVTTPVHAILITTEFSGEIYTADAGNAFGVLAGDAVTGSATYDNNLVAASGQSSVNISSNSDFELFLTIGSYMFDHTMDVEYPAGTQPTVEFLDGQILSFDFVTLEGINGALYGLELFLGTEFTAIDTDQLVVTGEITNFGATPIPVPSTILLYGIGFVGLLMANRCQKLR